MSTGPTCCTFIFCTCMYVSALPFICKNSCYCFARAEVKMSHPCIYDKHHSFRGNANVY